MTKTLHRVHTASGLIDGLRKDNTRCCPFAQILGSPPLQTDEARQLNLSINHALGDGRLELNSINDYHITSYDDNAGPGGTQSGTPGGQTQCVTSDEETESDLIRDQTPKGVTTQRTDLGLPCDEENGIQLLETLKCLLAALSPEQRRQLVEWLTRGES